jgi:hypothetical protein
MNQIAEDDNTMRRYLLGQLPPHEQGEIEERLFLDSEYFQHLRMAEDELIDDYVYEELSADERERFDNYFLATFGRPEALRIARALKKYTSENPASMPSALTDDEDLTTPSKIAFLPSLRTRQPLLWLSLAAAILLIILGGAWLIIRVIRPPGNRQPLQAQQPSPQQQEQSAETNANQGREPEQNDWQGNQNGSFIDTDGNNGPARLSDRTEQGRGPTPPARKPPAQVYSFLLLPVGPVREGGYVNKIDLPSDARAASLQIPLIEDAGYISYQVTLNRQDGSSIQTWTGLKPTTAESGEIVSVRVPAGLLRQEKYEAKLSGVTADGNVRVIGVYPFQVTRK